MTAPIEVLHVDDDPEFVEPAAAFFARKYPDISVSVESTVADGLARLEAGDVDCVVSDYDMPAMTGLELLEVVREEHRTCPSSSSPGRGLRRSRARPFPRA